MNPGEKRADRLQILSLELKSLAVCQVFYNLTHFKLSNCFMRLVFKWTICIYCSIRILVFLKIISLFLEEIWKWIIHFELFFGLFLELRSLAFHYYVHLLSMRFIRFCLPPHLLKKLHNQLSLLDTKYWLILLLVTILTKLMTFFIFYEKRIQMCVELSYARKSIHKELNNMMKWDEHSLHHFFWKNPNFLFYVYICISWIYWFHVKLI